MENEMTTTEEKIEFKILRTPTFVYVYRNNKLVQTVTRNSKDKDDGEGNILFDETTTQLIAEIESYKWITGKNISIGVGPEYGFEIARPFSNAERDGNPYLNDFTKVSEFIREFKKINDLNGLKIV